MWSDRKTYVRKKKKKHRLVSLPTRWKKTSCTAHRIHVKVGLAVRYSYGTFYITDSKSALITTFYKRGPPSNASDVTASDEGCKTQMSSFFKFEQNLHLQLQRVLNLYFSLFVHKAVSVHVQLQIYSRDRRPVCSRRYP